MDGDFAEVPKVFWLASYPKSGNTWLRLMLGAYKFDAPAQINVNNEVVGSDLMPYPYNSLAPVPLTQMRRETVLYLRHAALMHLSSRHPHVPCILKTHNANVVVGDVSLIPNEMTEGAIYIVRDPRDVVISYAEHIGRSIDDTIEAMGNMSHTLEITGTPLCHWPTSWSHHVNSWAEQEKFPVLFVRYEDLLADPVYQLKRALEFLEMGPVDLARAERAAEATEFSLLNKAEAEEGFKEASKHTSFFKRGKAGGWKKVLKKKQVSRIEKNLGDVMHRWGYLTVEEEVA